MLAAQRAMIPDELHQAAATAMLPLYNHMAAFLALRSVEQHTLLNQIAFATSARVCALIDQFAGALTFQEPFAVAVVQYVGDLDSQIDTYLRLAAAIMENRYNRPS